MLDYFVENITIFLKESIIMAFIGAYIGGVFGSFTPCVYPLIPITAAFIGALSSRSKARGFTLSITYVLGMALIYTILGAFAAITGKLFGQIQSNPWTYVIVANIYILMGLSMLDVFNLPVRVPGFISKAQHKRKGIFDSFFMGAISGVIIGPCTVPILASLLSYVATTQNIPLGMSLLFTFSIGLGTLLIFVGTFASLLAKIPKSGIWMVRIKHIAGWILLIAGEYFLIKAGGFWI